MAMLLTQRKLTIARRRLEALRKEFDQETYLPGETIEHDRTRMAMKALADHLMAAIRMADLNASLLSAIVPTSDEEVAVERFGIKPGYRVTPDQKAKVMTELTGKLTQAEIEALRDLSDADIIRIAAHELPEVGVRRY